MTTDIARFIACDHAADRVPLPGTLIPIDRLADQKPYYSGKHHRRGVNVQVLADPAGRLVWASPALPGSTHDLTPPAPPDVQDREGLEDPGESALLPAPHHHDRAGHHGPVRHRDRPLLRMKSVH